MLVYKKIKLLRFETTLTITDGAVILQIRFLIADIDRLIRLNVSTCLDAAR